MRHSDLEVLLPAVSSLESIDQTHVLPFVPIQVVPLAQVPRSARLRLQVIIKKGYSFTFLERSVS